MFEHYSSMCEAAAKPLGIAGSGLTHEVPFRDLHHRLRSLHDVEAYRTAVEATVLSVTISPAHIGIKGSRVP